MLAIFIHPQRLPKHQYVYYLPTLILGIWILFGSSCSSPKDISYEDLKPEANRFIYEDLVHNLNEPMELDFLPEGQILFIERRGVLKMYDPETEVVQVVGKIPVHYVNENGLLGMAVDPNFGENNWLYFFYTDSIRGDYQQVSRFDFVDHQLVNDSEKKLLDFYIDVYNCCHFGGSIAFGPEGNLFISSGDNVGGKDYAPLDERAGRFLHDSQRSSGNANDLRGTILRIKPEPDGTYSIPEGNLFPKNTAGTRPEIYVMGARNPLKIDVDDKTGWLYWGDVGPNPGWKYPNWGPPSLEEVNQAKEAGNYGWPYFLGDNQAFRDVDFGTMQAGNFFDPNRIINDSPNNTGIKELPPAQKALIWYPNTASDTFPLVGTGGGTVCAGPVYHYDEQLQSQGKWPLHFDNKVFIYEWMRSWVLAVELTERGDYKGMENPFDGNPFKKPIDIEFGPDGMMYVLDYGSNWYAHNSDARLTRVSYEYGNRAPKAKILADVSRGASPLDVQFTAKDAFDLDRNDKLTYEWELSEGSIISRDIQFSYTFKENQDYEIKLRVMDKAGAVDSSTRIISVGNDPPQVELQLSHNKTFFIPNQDIPYQLEVKDVEDGSTLDGNIIEEDVQFNLRHLKNTTNVRDLRMESTQKSSTFAYLKGKNLLEGSDCYACHAMNAESVGPSLEEISQRYEANSPTIEQLTQKVLNGGSGVWGDKLMSAHPQHTKAEAEAMVRYILALTEEDEAAESLPLEGIISTKTLTDKDLLLLTASYTDAGGNGQPPIQEQIQAIFRPALVPATEFDYSKRIKAKPYNEEGDLYAEVALNGCYIGFKDIDLTHVKSIRTKIRSTSDWVSVDIRQNSPEGPSIGKGRKELGFTENKWAAYKESDWFIIEIPINASNDQTDLYFIFDSSKLTSEYIYYDICQVHSFEFGF